MTDPSSNGGASPREMALTHLGRAADLAWIEPGFALGSRPYEHQRSAVREAGIDVVVALVELLPEEIDAWRAIGVQALSFPTQDWIGIPPARFDEVVGTILEQRAGGQSVLLHCLAGVNRAPTMAAAVLCRSHRLSPEEAVARVQAVRPSAAPTPQQMGSLRAWLALPNA